MSEAPPGGPLPPPSPRQTRMGPAPFASFEDLSDEVRPKGDSPEEKPIIRLPDISEDDTISEAGLALQQGAQLPQATQVPPQAVNAMENLGPNATTPQGSGNLQTPSTPRIDISRASSSSHHDSRDSSPENAIFGIGDSIHDPEGAKLGLGFREDGTADLRSSTEELAFLEPNSATGEKESSKQPSRRSPLMFKQPEDHHRKDSQCSDIVLLSISGRTSRLSSIGSQGSGHSNASGHSNMSHISGHSNVSHISGQSRLSVISGISRSPSPHKMLLETSFCGPKPLENDVGVVVSDKNHSEVLEQVLLSRKHDPKDAILAEGISVNKAKGNVKPLPNKRLSLGEIPKYTFELKESSIRIEPPETTIKEPITSPVITVSTLGSSYKNDSKKPNPAPPQPPVVTEVIPKPKPVVSAMAKKPAQKNTNRASFASEPEYIRIKLKPDHMYSEDDSDQGMQQEAMQKPVSLNLSDHTKKNAPHFSQLVKNDDSMNKISQYTEESCTKPNSSITIEKPVLHSQPTPGASPKQSKQCGLKDHGSRTPSPAGRTPSRKSSFCSLFKSRETIASPESPTSSGSKRKGISGIIKDASGSVHGSRSRSKSRDRDKSGSATPTSGGKPKGSVLAIFKPTRKSSASTSPVARESLPNLDAIQSIDNKYSLEPKSVQNQKQTNKERLKYYDAPVDGVIRIPLHTPSDEEDKPVIIEKTPIKSTLYDDNTLHQIKIDRPVSAPSSSRPSFSQPPVISSEKSSSRQSDQIIKQEIISDNIIRIPLHSPSEDRLVRCDLMSEKEIEELNKLCSNISTKKNSISEKASNGSMSSSTEISKTEEIKVKIEPPPKNIETPVEPEIIESSPEAVIEVEIERNNGEEKMSAQAKKHIIFATKVGSKEQIFSMQFSLSKTDSQSSQMSENRSQISEESVIEVQLNDKNSEEKFERTPSLDGMPELVNINNKIVESPEVKEIVTEEVNQVVTNDILASACERIVVQSPPKEVEPDLIPKEAVAASTRAPKLSPRNSVLSEEMAHDSSESERDSELDFIRKKQLQALEKSGRCLEPLAVDHERKGLVMQQESFDDELPYIPTTLPQERSVALPIVPVKQRQGIEVKTCPIDRPRSTTPINPSCLEEYCSDEVYTPDAVKAERLKISLPRDEAQDKPRAKQKAKSPRRVTTASSPKTWFEFAEQGISNTGPRKSSTGHESDSDPAPPLPPRAPVPKSQWINFENIPERRKAPKRIQTIPSRTNVEVANEANVVYTYVNPEDCKCECHESGKDTTTEDVTPDKEEDEEPLLDETAELEGMSAPPAERIQRSRIQNGKDRQTHICDTPLEYSYSHRPVASTATRVVRNFSTETNTSSNRSSITSQDADRSSSSGSPNDVVFPSRRPPSSP